MTINRVGLLTCQNTPLLPYFLNLLYGRELNLEVVIIFDAKKFSTKNERIFSERTGGKFPIFELSSFLDVYQNITFSSHNSTKCIEFVKSEQIDLLVNIDTPRIIKNGLINAPTIGILNVHPGLLPNYGGSCCCEWAIYYDDPIGVTAHFMDSGIDSGPVLFSRQLIPRKGQTYTDIRTAIHCLSLEITVEAVCTIFQKKIKLSDLDSQENTRVFKPIPDSLLEIVKGKLKHGTYKYLDDSQNKK